MEGEESYRTRPMPMELADPQAFYALPHGCSMVSAAIGPADFCLVSPCGSSSPPSGSGAAPARRPPYASSFFDRGDDI